MDGLLEFWRSGTINGWPVPDFTIVLVGTIALGIGFSVYLWRERPWRCWGS
jgi:hypothetical protein